MVFCISAYECNHVAIAEYLVFTQDMAGGDSERCTFKEMTLGHDVGSSCLLYVFGCDYTFNSRHLLSFRAVYTDDSGMMRHLWLDHCYLECFSRHLQFLIITVIGQSAYLGQSRRAGQRLPVILAILLMTE